MLAPKFNIGDRIIVADTINWYRGKTAVVVEDHGYDGMLERRIYTVQMDAGSTVFFPLREEQMIRADSPFAHLKRGLVRTSHLRASAAEEAEAAGPFPIASDEEDAIKAKWAANADRRRKEWAKRLY